MDTSAYRRRCRRLRTWTSDPGAQFWTNIEEGGASLSPIP